MSYIDHSKNNAFFKLEHKIDSNPYDISSTGLTNVSDEQKIKRYILNVEPEIQFNNASSSTLKRIFESAKTARQKSHSIRQIDRSVVKPIHDRDSYPLCYLFFNLLKKTELLDQLVSFIPDLSDLPTFIEWYRDINSFDFQDVRKIMNDVIKNNNKLPTDTDADTDSNTNIIALIELYKMMFEPTDKDLRRSRCLLHKSVYDNRYISADVQCDLESTELIYSKYLINNRHHIDVFVPINTQGPDMDVVATLIDTVMNLSSKEKPLPSVNLTIIYSNQKKLVYPGTLLLSSDNINSGSTYPTKSIVCWRREEFYKVLIHELFHYYEYDFYHDKYDPFYDELDKTINVPKLAEGSTDSLNEAYTETMAILILSIVHYTNDQYLNSRLKVSIDANKNNPEEEKMEYLTKMIKEELAFVMFQVAKILVIFGATSFDQYLTKQKSIEIYQSTSFRSYFIIKMLLLSNLDNLLNLIDNKGIEIKEQKILEYRNLINDSWDKFIISKNMIKIMDKYMIDIINAFNTKNKDWIYKTCRMCVNDTICFKRFDTF